MNERGRVYVAGHTGMVGSAIVRALQARGHRQILTAARADVDLREQAQVRAFFRAEQPTHVFLAAARVGGILANDSAPADFLYDNLMIEANVLHAALLARVDKLLFLGSACIYPRLAPQPLREEHLLTGPLEPTNEAYAVAKIAGVKLCQAFRRQHGADFIAAMPNNLYGPGDNFDLQGSHVLPGLLRKIHEAKAAGSDTVVLWGSGAPRREFLHVDDCAAACLLLMDRYSGAEIVNVGYGSDLTIRELAALIATVVGWTGTFVHDAGKPDGTPRKIVDTSRIAAMGWQPRIRLDDGIAATYRWFLEHGAGRAR